MTVNHSCDPNVAFDVSSGDKSNWRLKALKNISKGESLEFFYPSTEWSMTQPFDCLCNKSVSFALIHLLIHLAYLFY